MAPPMGVPPGAPAPSEREAFYAKLHTFREEIGEPIQRLPTLGFKELDLCVLYREVTKRNGIDSVIANKQWKEVAEALQLPSSCTDSGFRLRLHYKKYLEAFERKFFSPAPPRGTPNKHVGKNVVHSHGQAQAHSQTHSQSHSQSQHHVPSQSQPRMHMSVHTPSHSNGLSELPESHVDVRPVVMQTTTQCGGREMEKSKSLPERSNGKMTSVPGSCATSATVATVGGEISAGSGSSNEKRRRSRPVASQWKKGSVQSGEEVRKCNPGRSGCPNASANISIITGSYPSSENAEDDDGRRSNEDESVFNMKPTNTMKSVCTKRSHRGNMENKGISNPEYNDNSKKRMKLDKLTNNDSDYAVGAGQSGGQSDAVNRRSQKRARVVERQCEKDKEVTNKDGEKASDSSQESANITKAADKAMKSHEKRKADRVRTVNEPEATEAEKCSPDTDTTNTLPNGELQTLLEFIQAVRRG